MKIFEITSSQADTAVDVGQGLAGSAVAAKAMAPAVAKTATIVTKAELTKMMPLIIRAAIRSMGKGSVIGKALFLLMLLYDGWTIQQLWSRKDATPADWQFTIGDVLLDVGGLLISGGWKVAGMIAVQLERSAYHEVVDAQLKAGQITEPGITGVAEHDFAVNPQFFAKAMKELHQLLAEVIWDAIKDLPSLLPGDVLKNLH